MWALTVSPELVMVPDFEFQTSLGTSSFLVTFILHIVPVFVFMHSKCTIYRLHRWTVNYEDIFSILSPRWQMHLRGLVKMVNKTFQFKCISSLHYLLAMLLRSLQHSGTFMRQNHALCNSSMTTKLKDVRLINQNKIKTLTVLWHQ